MLICVKKNFFNHKEMISKSETYSQLRYINSVRIRVSISINQLAWLYNKWMTFALEGVVFFVLAYGYSPIVYQYIKELL